MSTGSDMRSAARRVTACAQSAVLATRLGLASPHNIALSLPSTPSRSLGTHEFMALVTPAPLSIEALNAATVHDKDGTATSLANLFTGNKTLVLVLRHCL